MWVEVWEEIIGKKSFFIFTFVTRTHFQTNPDIQNNLSRGPRNSGAFQFQAMEKALGWSGWWVGGCWWGGGRCSGSVLVNTVKTGVE